MALLVAQLGCSAQRPPVHLNRWDERDLVKNATIIVLGTTTRVEWSDLSTEIHWSDETSIRTARLARVTIAVERVIRGPVPSNQVDVTYWAAAGFNNAASLNLPIIGERAVHYLRREDQLYRYVTDLVRSKTPVFSGSHRQGPRSADTSDEQAIAALLLTPSENADYASFSKNLGTSTAESLYLVGFTGTLPLLRELLKSKRPEVTWSACVTLAEYAFFGHEGCIDHLKDHPLASLHEEELKSLLGARSAALNNFTRGFLDTPSETARSYATIPGEAGIADFLRMIAQGDSSLASRATEELKLRGEN